MRRLPLLLALLVLASVPAPLLNTDELAAFLNISPTTIRTWRTRGGGPVATLVGRRVRYAQADVDIWLAGQRQARTPVPGHDQGARQ